MTEEKYNTKDIRHIDEKSQEYIAKGNRMTEEIIIDKEDKTKKHRNNEIDCLHFCCRKGESGNVLFWCDFYDDHCDNYTGCYYRKYLRLEQENKELKKDVQLFKCLDTFGESKCRCAYRCLGNEFCEDADKKINTYRSALEEIRILATKNVSIENFVKIQNKINEVL